MQTKKCKLQDLKDRAVLEIGAMGGATRYWVREVRVEGDKYVFDIGYAETTRDGKTWKAAPKAQVMLTVGRAWLLDNPLYDHPSKPTKVEFMIDAQYVDSDISVMEEGVCLSEIALG